MERGLGDCGLQKSTVDRHQQCSLASHTYFAEVGEVMGIKIRMVTLARFPCAAEIHYRHDVQLITDNRRCEEQWHGLAYLLTCFGERLAEENCFTARSIAIIV